MGVTATTRLPAGWYPDPDGGNRRRWWDGREWTQYTAEFQRPTSVDELDLDQTPAATGRKPGKAAKVNRWLRRVETAASETVEADPPDTRSPRRRVAAERLGRWLAGAVHRVPTPRRSGRRRGTHRSAQ